MDRNRRSGSPSDQRDGSHRRRRESSSRWDMRDMRSALPPEPRNGRAATTHAGPDPAQWMSRPEHVAYAGSHPENGRRRGAIISLNGESPYTNGASHARPPNPGGPQRHSSARSSSRVAPYDRADPSRSSRQNRADHSRSRHAPVSHSQRGPPPIFGQPPQINGYGPPRQVNGQRGPPPTFGQPPQINGYSPPRQVNGHGPARHVDGHGPPPQVDGHGSPPRANAGHHAAPSPSPFAYLQPAPGRGGGTGWLPSAPPRRGGGGGGGANGTNGTNGTNGPNGYHESQGGSGRRRR